MEAIEFSKSRTGYYQTFKIDKKRMPVFVIITDIFTKNAAIMTLKSILIFLRYNKNFQIGERD